jgi:DNA excision repair protein ERCC-2
MSLDKSYLPDKKVFGYSDFFPYPDYRPSQESVIQQLTESMALGKNAVLVATNGTGKTIMALSAALPLVIRDPKRKILFCSRTFTQNARVIQETREITKHFAENDIDLMIGALSLRGRNQMCPHKMLKRLQLPPSESMSLCANLRKNKRCHYFNNLMKLKRNKSKFEQYVSSLASTPVDAQDLLDFAEQDDVCPYFFSKFLMEFEKIIVCNYQWIFNRDIRKNFLENLGISLQNCIIIMDECHNLPDMANGINSYRLTPYHMRNALKDLEATRASYSLIDFTKSLKKLIENAKTNVQEEVELKAHRFIQQVMNKNNLSSLKKFELLLNELKEYGDAIEFEKIDQGKVPRNFIRPIIEFFTNLIEHMDDPAYFPCMTASFSNKGKTVALELKCLSPRLITDVIFQESFSTLSLSGTLDPFTFTSLLGLNKAGKMLKICKMPPPFPKKNVQVLLINQLNTKGENRNNEMYRAILKAIHPILLYTPKNVGVFCASYEVVNGLWKNGFEKLAQICNKKPFKEEAGMAADDNDIIIEQYKDCIQDSRYNGGALLGVCGGRNSEGEDFPGDFMNAVIVVGVPFQRPTPSGNAKIEYYDKLFPGKGRIFGYTVPAITRSNQACGRPIRRMEDKGLIVLMDFRFWTYKAYLSNWIRSNAIKIPNDPHRIAQKVKNFFKNVE